MPFFTPSTVPGLSGVQAAGDLYAIGNAGRISAGNRSLSAVRHHNTTAALGERCAAAALHRVYTHAEDQSQVWHQL